MTCEIPHIIKFNHQPQLDALIRDLTEAFAVRYEEPPLDDDFEILKDMQTNNAFCSALQQTQADADGVPTSSKSPILRDM